MRNFEYFWESARDTTKNETINKILKYMEILENIEAFLGKFERNYD